MNNQKDNYTLEYYIEKSGEGTLSDKDVIAIGKLLATDNTLTQLHLGFNNKVTDVKSIGDALKTNTTLEILILSHNGISNVNSIGDALKRNKTLKKLWLNDNNITDSGIQSIIEALKTNNTLKTLRLSDNRLSETIKSQLNAIKHYKLDGSNGYQRVDGMEIHT